MFLLIGLICFMEIIFFFPQPLDCDAHIHVKNHFNLPHTWMAHSYLNTMELHSIITARLLSLCDLRDGTVPFSQGSVLLRPSCHVICVCVCVAAAPHPVPLALSTTTPFAQPDTHNHINTHNARESIVKLQGVNNRQKMKGSQWEKL